VSGGDAAGLYLHVPFCSVVCPYCDFAVRPGRPARNERFVEHLLSEAALEHPALGPFDTVYLGGGTPSILTPEQLSRLLDAVRRALPIADEARVAMEVNPEDVTREAAAAWRSLGVGTASLGVQSFDAATLKRLGRRHSPEQARRSVELVREAGFDTVNVDLIFAVPGQDEAGWRRELETAAALGPDHVSAYQLTFHEGTPFHRKLVRGELAEAPEPAQAALFRLTHRVLADAGLEAYEVSNFARAPEHRSAHNRKYWRHVPYLGLGPSAHSFDGRRRWWNLRDVEPWQEALAAGRRPVADEETLGPAELALEALLLGLRTTEGVDLAAVEALTGLDLGPPNAALVERLAEQGLLRASGRRLVPTLDGLAVADALPALFALPTASAR
jgi:oxygen-independent coproporphyrinogen-3 oxidase